MSTFTRTPDDTPPSDDVATEFMRLACLTYGDDSPQRRDQARALLVAHPEIAESSIHAAATVADAGRVRRFLADDPAAATREGGPHEWAPLMYLTYSRVDRPGADAVATARALLDAGADPNTGYLWHGLPTPFTALTGVFGEGERGPAAQPRHPHSDALARVLLDAGANPNDGQAIYNRMFERRNDHLELLFEYGLGRGDGGPWRARVGAGDESPHDMLRSQLGWAIAHGWLDRVRLLVDNGVDPAEPDGSVSTTSAAALAGHPDVVEYLVAQGAPPPDLDAVDAFLAAALAGNRAAVTGTDAAVVAAARERRPGIVVWAAALSRPDAIRTFVDAGFDVNARGRSDIPVESDWETALHVAAMEGDLALCELLLSLGADPSIRDKRFDATPRGWAEYGNQPETAALLAPLTP